MDIKIRGEKIEITTAMKKHAIEKLEKLDKHFEQPEEVTATILVKGKESNKIVEVTVPTRKFTIRAEEAHNDFYAAVDIVVDKLERQIRKNKSKLRNKYKNVEPIELSLEDLNDDVDNNAKIVKRKSMIMKPMDEEEALIQSELLNHDFFVFKNIDEECVSVLYKRKDENYGIINVK